MGLATQTRKVLGLLLMRTSLVVPVVAFLSLPCAAQVPPAPTVNAVVNSADLLPNLVRLAPGEIVSFFGSNMGPTTGVGARLTPSGLVDTLVANTRVLFDGVPAPLIFVRNDQINAIVPYAVAGKTTTAVVVESGGVRSNVLNVPVAASAPGIFAISSGRGQGAILKEDGTYNSSTNPARLGSIVVIYATGEGQTNPPGIDGKLATEPLPRPVLPVSVMIGGVPAEIIYAGAAPGFAGLLQVNARIPLQSLSGNAHGDVPVRLTVGSVAGRSTVTLRVNPLPPEISVTPGPVTPCSALIVYPSNGSTVSGRGPFLIVGSVRAKFDFAAAAEGSIPAVATLSSLGRQALMYGIYQVGQSTGTAFAQTALPDGNARQGLTPGGGPVPGFSPGVLPYLNLLPLPNGPNHGNGTAEWIFQSEPYNGQAGRLTFTPTPPFAIPPSLLPSPGVVCEEGSGPGENVGIPFGLVAFGVSFPPGPNQVVLTVTIGGVTVATATSTFTVQ